jgi:hypothetical protein
MHSRGDRAWHGPGVVRRRRHQARRLARVTGHVVEVKVDIANGLVGMNLVGLPVLRWGGAGLGPCRRRQ